MDLRGLWMLPTWMYLDPRGEKPPCALPSLFQFIHGVVTPHIVLVTSLGLNLKDLADVSPEYLLDEFGATGITLSEVVNKTVFWPSYAATVDCARAMCVTFLSIYPDEASNHPELLALSQHKPATD